MNRLHNDLLAINYVDRVDSILNVPVFADTPLTAISEDYLTLLDEGVDLNAARQEMMVNPVYRDALISPDGRGAGMQVSFEIDQTARGILNRRSELRQLRLDGVLDAEGAAELREVEDAWSQYSIAVNARQHELVSSVREVLDAIGTAPESISAARR